MKKILLTLVTGVCLCGAATAQEPKKAAAKKRNVTLTVAPTSPSDEKAEMAERIKAKQKHYEALKTASKNTPETAAKADDVNGSRKKKAN